LDARRQDCGCVSFPLNVADGAILDAQVSEPGSQPFSEHADAGKQLDGMNSHVMIFLFVVRWVGFLVLRFFGVVSGLAWR
jgi:hypothetical protein